MEAYLPKDDELAYQKIEYIPKFTKTGQVDISSLLMTFQNACMYHVERLNVGEEFKKENNLYYVLCRLKGYFLKPFSADEKYTLITYPSKLSALQMYRYAYILSSTGEVVFYLISVWVFIDQVERKLKTTKAFKKVLEQNLPGYENLTPLSDEILYSLPRDGEYTFSYVHLVEKKDIDSNKHMNNTRYALLAQQALADCNFSSFEIDFEKECYLSQMIKIERAEDEDSISVRGLVGDELSFLCKFYR